MLSPKGITCLGFAAAFLFGNPASAAPQANEARYPSVPHLNSRDDSSNSTTNGTKTSLEPIVPPTVDPEDLFILSLGTNVTLAWAGSPDNSSTDSSPQRRTLKRDGGILSQAVLTFVFPTIPLDHSLFVTDVSCTNGSLTGTLSSNAYGFAKKEWTGAADIVFVTSVDGCGLDNQNDFFHAKSISFSDSNKSFTATGSSAAFTDVALHLNLKWGNLGSTPAKRAVDKRDVSVIYRFCDAIALLLQFCYIMHLFLKSTNTPVIILDVRAARSCCSRHRISHLILELLASGRRSSRYRSRRPMAGCRSIV